MLHRLRQWYRFSLVGISLMVTISCQKIIDNQTLLSRQTSISEKNTPSVQEKIYELPNAVVHTLFIPREGNWQIEVAVADTLETVENLANKHHAVAVLNGGFFDPVNGQTTSYGMHLGEVVADPAKNPRLMDNPKLQPYLEKILNRSEFRRYQCGEEKLTKYAIAYRQQPVPSHCQLTEAIGGGPRLLPEITAEQEAFWESSQGQVTRDPLGIKQPNARTAIAITAAGDVIWVMVQQTSLTSGLSLLELREFLKSLGATEAVNLDGGSSSSLFYRGKVVYGKKGQQGEIKRPVKSVLLIKEQR